MRKYIIMLVILYGMMSQKLLFEGAEILEREYSAYANLQRTAQFPVEQRSQLDLDMGLREWRVTLELPNFNADPGGTILPTDTVDPTFYR